jgi:hypothetical protein
LTLIDLKNRWLSDPFGHLGRELMLANRQLVLRLGQHAAKKPPAPISDLGCAWRTGEDGDCW